MEKEGNMVELTPENYLAIQNSIAENVAKESNRIIDCKKIIASGKITIKEKEEEIKKLEYEIIDIENKCAQINSILATSQRSIKIDTYFLSKLNAIIRRGKKTSVNVEKRLIKRIYN